MSKLWGGGFFVSSKWITAPQDTGGAAIEQAEIQQDCASEQLFLKNPPVTESWGGGEGRQN